MAGGRRSGKLLRIRGMIRPAALTPVLLFALLSFPLSARPAVEVSERTLGPAPNGQQSPALATDGTAFFAVWDDRRYGGGALDVFGSRIGADGRPLDPTGIPVSATSTDDIDPAIVWNGTDYVVVWCARPLGVFQARITRNGEVTRTELIEPQSPQSIHSFSGTAVAWSGSSYLVAFSEQGAIVAILLDAEGNVASGRIIVAPTGSGATQPRIATNGESYVVAWEDSQSVRTAAVSATGIVSNGAVLGATVPRDFSIRNMAHVDLAFDGREYLVVWSGPELSAQRLDASGTPVGDRRIVSAAGENSMTPRTIARPGGWLVVWSASGDLHSAVVDAAVNVVSGGRVTETPEVDMEPTIAANAAGTMIAWRSGPKPFSGDVVAVRLAASGAPAGAPHVTALAVQSQLPHSVAVADGVILAVWHESLNDAFGTTLWRRFNSDGSAVDDVAQGQLISVVTASEDAFLLVSRRRDSEERFATIVPARGEPYDPVLIADRAAATGAASDGRHFLVAWSERRSPSPNDWRSTVRAALVSASGTPSPIVTLSAVGENDAVSPVVVWTGTSYLVAWTDYYGLPTRGRSTSISARFVSVAGVPMGEIVTITPLITLGPFVTSAASNGAGEVMLTAPAGYYTNFPTDAVVVADGTTIRLRFRARYSVWNGSRFITADQPLAVLPDGSLASLEVRKIVVHPTVNGTVDRVFLTFPIFERQRSVRR